MTDKSAAKQHTPVPQSKTQRSEERDTLNDTPELRFLRDEIEALLGSPTVLRGTHTPNIEYAEPAQASAPEGVDHGSTAEFDEAIYERDTEPSVDVQLLREAVRAAGKK